MTFPRIRRHRDDGRAPAFAGDFHGDDRDITEILGPPGGWEGASGAGLRDGDIFGDTPPAAPQPRPADAALFDLTPAGHVLTCTLCSLHPCCDTPRQHADPAAAHAAQCFEALRASAHAAGWRTDALTGGWACPPCQSSPRYRTGRPFIHYDAEAARASDACGPLPARTEFWLRVAAEQDLLQDVRALRGRGAALIRPGGQVIKAYVVTRREPAPARSGGRHRAVTR